MLLLVSGMFSKAWLLLQAIADSDALASITDTGVSHTSLHLKVSGRG